MIRVRPIFFSHLNNNLSVVWNLLLNQSCFPTFQYDFEYMSAWCKYLSGDWKPFLLMVEEDNKTIGIFPLMHRDIKRRGILPYRWIKFLGFNKTDFSLVLASDINLPKVIDASLKWLFSGNFRWELIVLDDIVEGNPLVDAIKFWLEDHNKEFELKQGKYYYINMRREWEDIRMEMSKKAIRRSINLARNRITKAGPWKLITDPEWSANLIINEASKMHIARQEVLQRGSLYSEEEEKNFLRTIINHLRKNRIFRSHWLQFENKYIAYMIGFEQKNIYFAWNMAFQPDYSHFFPSKLLIFEIIKESYEKKIEEFNFMRGESEYKKDWTKQYRANYRFIIKNTNSIYGKVASFIDNFIH